MSDFVFCMNQEWLWRMKQSPQKANIFLIHAHSDRETVHKLYQRMVNDGLNVWLDAERLQPGQDWQNEIRNALLQCDAVIVCLSCVFDERKGYRHEELKLALEKANFLPDDEVLSSLCAWRNATCRSPCAASTVWTCSRLGV